MPANKTWQEWYDETLDALVTRITNANVDWATDGDGNPWIVEGQRRPRGIGYPHAMILRFTKQRNEATSTRTNELHAISTSISVFREGDVASSEENLRQALGDMSVVEDALYSDRSLNGTCDQLTITQSDAFELETANGHESVGDVQLTITKKAHLDH